MYCSDTGSTTTVAPVAFDHEVVGRGRALDVELVLKSRAAAALDADAQARGRRLGAENRGDLGARRAR